MPRIMGIGNVSGLSKKHKPKRAGSFKGMGIILEGDPKRLRGLGKKKSLRGTPDQHERRGGTTLQHAARELTRGEQATTCHSRVRAGVTVLQLVAIAGQEWTWAGAGAQESGQTPQAAALSRRARALLDRCLKK